MGRGDQHSFRFSSDLYCSPPLEGSQHTLASILGDHLCHNAAFYCLLGDTFGCVVQAGPGSGPWVICCSCTHRKQYLILSELWPRYRMETLPCLSKPRQTLFPAAVSHGCSCLSALTASWPFLPVRAAVRLHHAKCFLTCRVEEKETAIVLCSALLHFFFNLGACWSAP